MIKGIEKPLRSATAEEKASLLNEKKEGYQEFLKRCQQENYHPWRTARHIAKELKIPAEAAWEALLIHRNAFRSIKTPIKSVDETNFRFGVQTAFWAFAHRLDQSYCGKDNVAEDLSDERHRYLVEGIMEEAVASSQLEGARTTRSAAIALLKSGREAVNDDERMIVNNFRAMQAIEERFVREDLSIANILELHSILVEGLKDDEGETPRLREEGEAIYVTDKLTGEIYHEGPPSEFVQEQLLTLCGFANSRGNDVGAKFTHPFIKAVEIHFWIGYLHPFTDGNGRLARILFYWCLLRRGYWAAAFLPISSVIKDAKEEYPRAYQLSEQDNYDLTYFIDFNVKKMSQAMDTFEKHRERIETRLHKRSDELEKYKLNPRQLVLVDYLIRHTEQIVSVKSHMLLSRVSKQTAISDLDKLVVAGLVEKCREGREVRYQLTAEYKKVFKK
jgi:Fic family protein